MEPTAMHLLFSLYLVSLIMKHNSLSDVGKFLYNIKFVEYLNVHGVETILHVAKQPSSDHTDGCLESCSLLKCCLYTLTSVVCLETSQQITLSMKVSKVHVAVNVECYIITIIYAKPSDDTNHTSVLYQRNTHRMSARWKVVVTSLHYKLFKSSGYAASLNINGLGTWHQNDTSVNVG